MKVKIKRQWKLTLNYREWVDIVEAITAARDRTASGNDRGRFDTLLEQLTT